ncbi:hypothetical protein C5Z25_01715 [Lactobacillus sp. CBA3605]|uniref:hypothetical protein n=1 Tax=Lactobacillus sp. CBA3605 TaxID=2099788 RepID=UPI000CFCDFF7|nr:hypothetical protein [Lactobacillus sp. CBA3605]AVK60564.1 hypothetical protein C5Z25_01715 [Lactobacillus sp. CBA3605]
MTVLQQIYYLSLVIFAILAGTWLYGKKAGKWQFISGKIVLYSLATAIVLYLIFIVAGLFFGNPANKSNTETEQSSSVISSSSSSSKKESSSSSSEKDETAGNILSNMDAKELKEYNDSLLKSLNEDQGYANDGKKGYEYATYIDTLAFDHNKGLIVKVNSEFTTLNDAQKTTVANGAQKLAAAQLVIIGKDISADSSPIQTNVHYGADRVGHSKYTNSSEFKWTK